MFRTINITILIALVAIHTAPVIIFAQVEEENPSSVETGDIEVDADISNETNEGETQVEVIEEEEDELIVVENSSEAESENDVQLDTDSGENDIENEEGDSYISTGDHDIDLGLENQANNNNTSFSEIASSSQEELDDPVEQDSASTTVEELEESTASTTVVIENSNTATTTNVEIIDASSGSNSVSGGNDAYIDTGDIAIVNVLINFINSNFSGDGKEYFVNVFNEVAQSIDLSGFIDESEGESDCEDCNLEVNNNNSSTLDNSIVIDANTGENLIEDTSGSAIIETGDIDIVNDVLNIANLNVTGDDWFFAVVNIFGELEGDVVLPSAYEEDSQEDEFLEELASSTETLATPTDRELIIANENAGELFNDIIVEANTGENETASSTQSEIITGDVEVNNQIFNLINYNVTGDSWKFAKVNVFGNWEGIIQGLPEGYSYQEDDEGITIYNTFLDDYRVDAAYSQLLLNNQNQATTTNTIEIYANTGENSVSDSEGYAGIATGDVNIQNSLLNFINSNFTGNNWEFSMVNVFGDWKGNLSFGQPELWIIESIDKTDVNAGEYLTYTYLFGNSGDAIATDVAISDLVETSLISMDSIDPSQIQGSTINWDLGDLPPNTQGSVSYQVMVKNSIPSGTTEINNSVLIYSNENERDYINNEDSGMVFAHNGSSGGSNGSTGSGTGTGSSGGGGSKHPNFSILKTNDADTELKPGDIVNYTITIKNFGSDHASDVLVLDVLRKQGEDAEIHSELWELGTVYKGEEIIIEYALEINENIGSGTYINEVMIEGYDYGSKKYVNSVASSKIKVDNDSAGAFSSENSDEESTSFDDEVLVLGEVGELILRANRIWPDISVYPGDSFEYKLIVKNIGDIMAYNVKANELLPEGFVFAGTESDNQIFMLGDIAPGFELSKPIEVEVLAWAQTGEHMISGEVSSDNYGVIELGNTMQVLGASEVGGGEVAEDDVEVLAETGFSSIQFVALAFTSLGLFASTRRIRKELK